MLNLKRKKMKKAILLLMFFSFFGYTFAQNAEINGINSPPDENVCDGSTYSMTAGLSAGVVDSVEWYLSLDGAAYTLASTAITIDAPISGVSVGHTYDYALRVYYDGTGLFKSTSISLIPIVLPTITGVVPVDVCNDGTLLQVDVSGLGSSFPVDVYLYIDGYAPGDLIYTEVNVSSASTTIFVDLGAQASGSYEIYGRAYNPITGCMSHP